MTQHTGKIPVGISSCLSGQRVRYDGDHRFDAYIDSQLAGLFELRPFCPEVAVGLGTPRAPIRLVRSGNGLRALGVDDAALDVTQQLANYGLETAQGFDDIYGYIFKARSPSCGLAGVRTWSNSGRPDKADGTGIFAQAIMQTLPNLPVEEDERLHEPGRCENFIERVLTWHHWQRFLQDGCTPAGLLDFHARHVHLVMARNPSAARRLEQLAAVTGDSEFSQRVRHYENGLMSAMKQSPSH